MLVNCGIFTDSIAYIRRAARLKEQYPRLSSTTYVSVLMASHEMRYGGPRRALPLARKAKAESDSTRNKGIDQNQAREKIHQWYQKVADCPLREVKAARDTIREKEDEVLNYFISRSTNAAAESLNSKIKAFRSQLHGVSDLPFFMYRLSIIFG